MSEQAPDQQQPEQGKRHLADRINWPATVVVSVVASIGATAYFHGEKHPEGHFSDDVHDFFTTQDTYKYTETTNEGTTNRRETETERIPVESRNGKSSFVLQKGAQQWARDFANDPAAGKFVNDREYRGVITGMERLARDGRQITKIKVTGFSSAEDNTKNAGLQRDSQQNKDLADFRAETVQDRLKSSIHASRTLKKAVSGVLIARGQPKEQRLTNEQVERVRELVQKGHYNSSKDLIVKWNRDPKSVSKHERKVLDEILADARRVEVNVDWKIDGREVYDRVTTCTDYQTTSYKREKKKDTLEFPWPIPVPVPIPKLGLLGRLPRRPKKEKPVKPPKPPKTHKPPKERMYSFDVRGELSTRRHERKMSKLGVEPVEVGKRFSNSDIARYLGKRLLQYSALAAVVAGINVSGENCKGKDHLPRPFFIVDPLWDLIDNETGHGAAKNQEFSIGIPFVKDAQLKFAESKDNIYGFDAEKPCRRARPPRGGVVARRCSVVEITRINGKETDRSTTYSAPPLKTTRIVKR